MKQLLRFSILVLFVFSAALARAEETPKFISKILPPIPVLMTETGGVKVSYITGSVNEQNAFSLCFENQTDKAISFTWTLTDKKGSTLASSIMTLAPNSRIDYSNAGDFIEFMVYTIDDNSNPSDCKITLEF